MVISPSGCIRLGGAGVRDLSIFVLCKKIESFCRKAKVLSRDFLGDKETAIVTLSYRRVVSVLGEQV